MGMFGNGQRRKILPAPSAAILVEANSAERGICPRHLIETARLQVLQAGTGMIRQFNLHPSVSECVVLRRLTWHSSPLATQATQVMRGPAAPMARLPPLSGWGSF